MIENEKAGLKRPWTFRPLVIWLTVITCCALTMSDSICRSQRKILLDLQRDIPKQFDFVIAENNFEVISGKQEGVYAWIAVNYALQKFSHGDEGKLQSHLRNSLLYKVKEFSKYNF